MRALINPGLALIRQHLNAFLLINILFFGMVVIGAAYTLFVDQQLQRQLTGDVVDAFDAPPFSWARDAYLRGDVPAAAVLTFLVNFFFGSILALTVPSLLIPFAGIFMGLYRSLLWGIIFAPTSPELAAAMVPHSVTMFLEGEGYVLVMFGVYLIWRRAFDGMRGGFSGFLAGYRAGLRDNAWVYVLAALVLIVAAIYEAIELIHIVGTS
jgi:hypothetical protein